MNEVPAHVSFLFFIVQIIPIIFLFALIILAIKLLQKNKKQKYYQFQRLQQRFPESSIATMNFDEFKRLRKNEIERQKAQESATGNGVSLAILLAVALFFILGFVIPPAFIASAILFLFGLGFEIDNRAKASKKAKLEVEARISRGEL